MPKSLLIITQKVDETDDLLGFFVAWIAEFARHFDRIDVIALGAGSYALPGNVQVYSLGKEQGVSKWRQAWRMAILLWRYTPWNGGVFCHMSPVFAILAWPLAVARGARLMMWYLHRSTTLRLRLAALLVHRIVTADVASLTFASKKIVSVGHGIDTTRFASARDWPSIDSRPLHILSVGRLSPIKDFGTLIHTAGRLGEHGVALEVRIVGRAVMPGDQTYAMTLRELAEHLKIDDLITFVGFVPYREMPVQYAWADIVVGCTPPGGIDKALLEAMAAGCVVMTSNTVMKKYLEPFGHQLIFPHGDSLALAAHIQADGDWKKISDAMITSVRSHHNLATTIQRITEFL